MAEDDVLAAAQRGDRDAHARLYEIFAKPVYTLARRMLGSRAHAEDVLQETFVEVLCNIADYRGDAVLGTWIKRIAVNKCLAYLRSGWRAQAPEGESLGLREGDVILDIGGRAPASPEHTLRILSSFAPQSDLPTR